MDSHREGYWSVCQTIDEAKAPMRFQPRDGPSGLPTPRPTLQPKPMTATGAGAAGEDPAEDFWAHLKEEPLSPSSPQPMAELTKEEMQFYESAKSRMTALQRTLDRLSLDFR
jgi:hypothetical protein